MLTELKKSLIEYKQGSTCDYRKLLDVADNFLREFPSGVGTKDDFQFGTELFRALVDLSYITSTKELENDHKLYREILQKKIRVFKRCIPSEYSELRGLTELLVGMHEDELG